MKLILVFPVLLLVIGWSFASVSFAQPQGGDDMAKLKERVAALEKAVLVNPLHPQETVVARLDTLENHVKQLEKADQTAEKIELTDDASLRKTLSDLQKQSDQLDKRLKLAEEDLHKRTTGDGGADIRDLRRAVDQLDRTVDDLKERVKRLEAKK